MVLASRLKPSSTRTVYPRALHQRNVGPVIKEIMLEMRAPYVIRYDSTNPLRDGTFRKVRVELVRPTSVDKLAAFARKGYTAPR